MTARQGGCERFDARKVSSTTSWLCAVAKLVVSLATLHTPARRYFVAPIHERLHIQETKLRARSCCCCIWRLRDGTRSHRKSPGGSSSRIRPFIAPWDRMFEAGVFHRPCLAWKKANIPRSRMTRYTNSEIPCREQREL